MDVENVFKRLRENRQKPEKERKSVITVVFEASKEVRMPILNSTLIIVASFVPLFFLSGMEGRMLAPLGITFVISLFASTFVCSYPDSRSLHLFVGEFQKQNGTGTLFGAELKKG